MVSDVCNYSKKDYGFNCVFNDNNNVWIEMEVDLNFIGIVRDNWLWRRFVLIWFIFFFFEIVFVIVIVSWEINILVLIVIMEVNFFIFIRIVGDIVFFIVLLCFVWIWIINVGGVVMVFMVFEISKSW